MTILATTPGLGAEPLPAERYDAIVIGAGFGGLGAALKLAESGARVLVCEALGYPGGCASTFQRGGARFESGATLFSGLAENQLFGGWIEKYGLDVDVDWVDPVVELRSPDLTLRVERRRRSLLEQLERVPGAPVEGLRDFYRLQEKVADALWSVLETPALMPPLNLRSIARHGARARRYLPLLGLVGRPLDHVLRRFGLQDFKALRVYLDGLCQITVQCSAAEAEAPFALSAMDYYYRGTGHVRGGIGVLATALTDAIRSLGGEVLFGARVDRVRAVPGGGWRVETSRGPFEAERVAANLLPQNLGRMLEDEEMAERSFAPLARRIEGGWGACMLYATVRPPADAGPDARHLELIHDANRPLTEGNHVFASFSSAHDGRRAPDGMRTVTVSTHVPMTRLLSLEGEDRGAYVRAVQNRMRRTLAERAPEWEQGFDRVMTASPRTFERFTRRFAGYVGGVPRRAGVDHYRGMRPVEVAPGLALVGDSVFPGQSILAAALGGVKTAEHLARVGAPVR